MRNRYPLLLLPFCALLLGATHKPLRKEKPATFPRDLADTAKAAFIKEFQRGQVLYDLNCGGCHNVKEGKRTIIPDFSLPQLLDYEMRMQYPEHGERLREVNVSVEELDAIQVFLQYRERSGHPVAPLPNLPPSQRE